MNENYPQRRRSSYDEELRQKYLIQKRKRMAHVRRLRILFCCLAVVIIAVIIFAVTVALRSGSKADKPCLLYTSIIIDFMHCKLYNTNK